MYDVTIAEFAMKNQVNESTGISSLFANYRFNPSLGIGTAVYRQPALSPQVRGEFLRAGAVAGRFERILTRLKALARTSQQRYEDCKCRLRAIKFKEDIKVRVVVIYLQNLCAQKLLEIFERSNFFGCMCPKDAGHSDPADLVYLRRVF
jgi:hypothetical protein